MKIRLGFVSNSSSASYTITLKCDLEETILFLREACSFPYLQLDQLIEKYNKQIEFAKSRIEHANRERGEWTFDSVESLEKTIVQYTKYIEHINTAIKNSDVHDDQVLKDALEYYRVGINPSGTSTLITCDTSMHNDFDEGLTGIVKEFILWIMFNDKNLIIKCKMECD